MSNGPLISFLVLTTPRRVDNLFPRIVKRLEDQAAPYPAGTVEILGYYDNKTRSLGEKRNDILQASHGKYIAFIDDDDWITDDYLPTIITELERPRDFGELDILCFTQIVTVNGDAGKPCHYGVDLQYTETPQLWTGKPDHKMVWRAGIAKQGVFPHIKFGEDTRWVAQVWPLVDLAKQVRLDKVIYHYNFRDEISETRD